MAAGCYGWPLAFDIIPRERGITGRWIYRVGGLYVGRYGILRRRVPENVEIM
jgi:hypothetical protein